MVSVATVPAMKEPIAAMPSACPRAPLTGHLVAVERRDDGRRLAGNVDEDGRRRAAVLRAVVDAGKHDEGADRVEAEGDRQQHRDRGDRADARQDADQRADDAADEAEADVLEGQGDGEAEAEVEMRSIMAQIVPSWPATSIAGGALPRVARKMRAAAAKKTAEVTRSAVL